jgi:hypothetical protein
MAKKKNITQHPTIENAQSDHFYDFGPERDIPTFYINNANFTTSDTEMRIDLSEVLETAVQSDGRTKIRVAPKVRVFVALPFAMRFLNAMGQQLKLRQEIMRAEFADKKAAEEAGRELARGD